ncbi:hypothetical protein FNF29_00427 [Cafeteria roenbergensis]|uniref:VCBS repeat-containing protein n=1 Tax=Cafeteria roenbergensis TaxID=33653 RepID=A0A5A8CVL6_CAFRO|nr:hypothetical protein FNF29_00427 [Cafeteria roenbergensis]|eukprot:KAA0157075.1 hypothetical protein FNF29_00427 [Cafeteria roenbergensis]
MRYGLAAAVLVAAALAATVAGGSVKVSGQHALFGDSAPTGNRSGFGGALEWVGGMGAIDGNVSTRTLAAGSPLDSTLAEHAGAITVAVVDAGGLPIRQHRIIDPSGSPGDAFGSALAWIGEDLNGDSKLNELAVGAPGRGSQGAVVILSLGSNGSASTLAVIEPGDGAALGFGSVLAWIPRDLDGDGFMAQMLVAAPQSHSGDVFVFSVVFNDTGGVRSIRSHNLGAAGDDSGTAVALAVMARDVDGNVLTAEILVGVPSATAPGNVTHAGAVHLLSVDAFGQFVSDQTLSASSTPVTGQRYGCSVAWTAADLDSDPWTSEAAVASCPAWPQNSSVSVISISQSGSAWETASWSLSEPLAGPTLPMGWSDIDVDGDGAINDLLVGSPSAPGGGSIKVFSVDLYEGAKLTGSIEAGTSGLPANATTGGMLLGAVLARPVLAGNLVATAFRDHADQDAVMRGGVPRR